MKKITVEQADSLFKRVLDNPASSTVKERLAFLKAKTSELGSASWYADNLRGANFMALFAEAKTAEERQLRGEKLNELCELIETARRGSDTAIKELDGLRKQTVDLYMKAKSNAGVFFREVPLAGDETPAFVYTFGHEVDVNYVAEGGGPRTARGVRSQAPFYFRMRMLKSDKVTYDLFDINLGVNIVDTILASINIAFDLATKRDQLMFTLLKTLHAPFNWDTGAKLARTGVLHSSVKRNNLPDTNILTLTGNGAATKIRPELIRAVLAYAASFGEAFGMALRPTGIIFVPSSDATGLADSFLPESDQTNGNTENSVKESVLTSFTQIRYNGLWTLVPDVTLDPDEGACYPVLSAPVGEIYSKPEFAREKVKQDDEEDTETRWAQAPVALSAPEPWRPRTCKVIYRTPA